MLEPCCGTDRRNGNRGGYCGCVGKYFEPGPFPVLLSDWCRDECDGERGQWKSGGKTWSVPYYSIGGNDALSQNSYVNIRSILDLLGVQNSPVQNHQNHFHIYLNPPKVKPITEAPHNLLADAAGSVNQMFDVSYNEDPQTGEATMLLSLLIPAVPPLNDVPDAPSAIVVAQAATPGKEIDMVLSRCEGVQTPDNPNGQLGGGITCWCVA